MARALIFDVDGTLAETEELHRAAFNAAFADAGLDWVWDVPLYGVLLRTTGGKERLRAFATLRGLAVDDALVSRLHAAKNVRYAALMRGGACALRPGVARLIRDAGKRGLRLAIATTTSRANVDVLLEATALTGLFEVIVAGDEVARKKPAPDVYLRVLDLLGLAAEDCLAFEDSRNGLLAACDAGLATVVTPGIYTMGEDFAGAREVLADLSEFALSMR